MQIIPKFEMQETIFGYFKIFCHQSNKQNKNYYLRRVRIKATHIYACEKACIKITQSNYCFARWCWCYTKSSRRRRSRVEKEWK